MKHQLPLTDLKDLKEMCQWLRFLMIITSVGYWSRVYYYLGLNEAGFKLRERASFLTLLFLASNVTGKPYDPCGNSIIFDSILYSSMSSSPFLSTTIDPT